MSPSSPSPSPSPPADALRAAAWFWCILASYSILRPIRDAMGIAGHVDDIKWLWNGTFVVTLLVAPLFAAAAAKLPRRELVTRSYHVIALILVAFLCAWQGSGENARLWLGRAFYVFVSVFNLFIVSVFWSAITDVFSRERATRSFGPIAVGGTLGAIAGSSLTAWLAETLGTANLLAASAALLEIGLWFARPILLRDALGDRALALAVPRGRAALADLGRVFASPLLRAIALYVFLLTFATTVLYLERSRLVADTFATRDARTAFFARVDLWTQLLTMLVQGFVTGPLIRRFGLGVALFTLPVVCVIGFGAVGGAALAGGTIFWHYVVFSVVLDATRHAVQRPSREVLFTLVPPNERYASKNAIDTAVQRGGDVVSAFAHSGITYLFSSLHAVLFAVVPVAVVWSLVAAGIGRHREQRSDAAPG